MGWLVCSLVVVVGAMGTGCGGSSRSTTTPAATYTVGGTLTGLSGTVVLQNNAADDLTLTEDDSFTFATALADGATYEVTVSSQPAGQTCSVSSSSGTISGADVTTVAVVCSSITYTVGGTVSGMTSDTTLVLQNNAADDLTITADGSFTFVTALADGADYAVTVLTQPTDKTCVLSSASGTLAGANVTDVSVVCVLSRWANSVLLGDGASEFKGVAVDADRNAYAVGEINEIGAFDFGNGVAVDGIDLGSNLVIAKYDTTGTPQWAKTVITGANESDFNGVAVDGEDNVYAVGSIEGTVEFDFEDGVTVTGVDDGSNLVIVKYNTSGTAQWAKTVTGGPEVSEFVGVAIDAEGSVYAVGSINGTVEFDFGSGITATGVDDGSNLVIVKYNTSGTPQWAKTVTGGGPNGSEFVGVAVDGEGNVYAVGTIDGNVAFDFGNSVTATGVEDMQNNSVIVKYDSNGTAQWAQTVTGGGPDRSQFNGVSVDADGNAYAVGEMDGNVAFDFGNSVTATGGVAGGSSLLVVKYDTSGTPQWAKTVTVGPGQSGFNGVAVDADGNAYAAGYIDETGEFSFGNGVTATGGYSIGNSLLIVKYDSTGTAQWAQTAATSPENESSFNGVAVDIAGDAYAVGLIAGDAAFDLGNGITATGEQVDDNNIVIVKYKSE